VTSGVPLQDLGVNSFEQLCINFANEQLQHFVHKAVISQEQVSGLQIPGDQPSPEVALHKGRVSLYQELKSPL